MLELEMFEYLMLIGWKEIFEMEKGRQFRNKYRE